MHVSVPVSSRLSRRNNGSPPTTSSPHTAGKYSFGNPWQLDEALRKGVVGPEILKTYNATIEFCRCMLLDHTEPVYCNLEGIRGGFFAISVLIVGLYEGSTTVKGMRSPAVRLLVAIATLLMYVSVIVVMWWQGEKCNSYSLMIDLRVVYSLALASLGVILIFLVVEGYVWIHALKQTRREKRRRGTDAGTQGGASHAFSQTDSEDAALNSPSGGGSEDEAEAGAPGDAEDDVSYMLFKDGGHHGSTTI